ncbi:MAG: sodium-translocating pyrophosphatase [Candidatus Nealsonbacteria bacterium]|nr:sodium-translocating pyrophosphatase [Candidatus Nealsonbacteria bacterium]
MLFLPIIVSIFSLIFAVFLIRQIQKAPDGSGKMVQVSQAIREGAIAYLKRQYLNIGFAALIIFFILWIIFSFKIGLAFLLGAIASGLSGFVGMIISTKTNIKVAEAAKKGISPSFSLAFQGSLVTGFFVAGLGLFSVSFHYLLSPELDHLIALAFGGSLISAFAVLGGGIYTKAADIGADLVGKIEKGIPEDDPRNPAVIADQVGDNVGDCAGIAADLFESYVVTLVAALILGSLIFPGKPEAIFLPLFLASIALLASILATFFVRIGRDKNIIFAFLKGLIASICLIAVGAYPIIKNLATALGQPAFSLYLSALIGLIVSIGIFLIANYFTSKKHSPVLSIVRASETGHATNIIAGLTVGMKSTLPFIILICLGVLISSWLAGVYGTAIAALVMLSLSGMIVALNAYGPIVDNASGIAEMSGLPTEVKKITDSLDAVGNTTKAISRFYAIASAGLAALALFYIYNQKIGGQFQFLLNDPRVLIGLLLGGLLPYLVSSFAMAAVGKTAVKMVEEVRRQFREIKGIMEGEQKPEYGKCVDIVTKSAVREMILPSLLPVAFLILITFILGPKALGGLLIGSVITGLFLATFLITSGTAWDNAKKYIEEGNLGGKGSFAHQAAVTGDTVGDPAKDCAGPAINPMIKVLNVVALLIVSFLV